MTVDLMDAVVMTHFAREPFHRRYTLARLAIQIGLCDLDGKRTNTRRLAKQFGVPRPTMVDWVKRLQRKGWVTRGGRDLAIDRSRLSDEVVSIMVLLVKEASELL